MSRQDCLKEVIEEYCKSCQKEGMHSYSNTSLTGKTDDQKIVLHMYRIKALEMAVELEDKEFLEKCKNCSKGYKR